MKNKFDERATLIPNSASKELEEIIDELCFWSLTEAELQMMECSLKALIGKHANYRMIEIKTGFHPKRKVGSLPNE